VKPKITRREELLAAGVAEHEVRRMVRVGELAPLRRGAYSAVPLPSLPEQRHELTVRAAVPELAPNAVVSHASAAVLHGMRLWAVPLRQVHVTRARRSGARRSRVLHVHAAPLDPDEIEEVDGILVTTPARTVIDLARMLPFELAVVVADGALHLEQVTPAELALALQRCVRRPGAPQARRAIAFADGGAMSVGESRSRVAMHRAGLPSPVLQWKVPTRLGTAEVDFGWPQFRAVGEFDGKVKYGRLLKPGQDPGDAVFEEKIREDALRDEDLRVARWIWAEIDHFDPVAERIRRAFR
jgi:hypothetical protein